MEGVQKQAQARPEPQLGQTFEPIEELYPIPAIGIDLGTSKSCVAVFRHGRVEIITNEHGNRTTPSYAAFTDSRFLLGDAAKNQVSRNPCNSIFGVKRILGSKFEDQTIREDINQLPFQVVNDLPKLKIRIKYKGEHKTFFPEQVSSMVLRKMKEIAEDYLGMAVHNAVVSVPAYFNTSQRRATWDAGIIAGFTKLRLVCDSSAAAIAYGLENTIFGERNVLIFNLGGGTLGASIITINGGIFDIKSTAGDTHLGGDDFDSRMVNHFVQEFKRKHNKDLTSDYRALMRLRTSCERAKITLSSNFQASIEIDSLFEGIDLHATITRPRFEELNADLFRSAMEPVEESLRRAKMDKDQVHEVVLVGGSSRIPKIQKLLQDYFQGKKLNKSINPDEAVAYGAAVQAATLQGNKSEMLQSFVLLCATPHSLGVETFEGNMSTLIKRNTSIPTKQTFALTYKPTIDHITKNVSNPFIWETASEENHYNTKNLINQFPWETASKENHPEDERSCNLHIKVIEGDRDMTSDNNLLGILHFVDIPYKYEIEITFDIQVNYILNVTALEKKTNKKVNMTQNNAIFWKEDIERMIIEAQSYSNEKVNQNINAAARNRLESCCFNILSTIDDEKIMWKVSENVKTVIIERCNEIIYWTECNQLAEEEDYEQKQKDLKRLFKDVIIESYKEVVADQKAIPHASRNHPTSHPNFTFFKTPKSEEPSPPELEELTRPGYNNMYSFILVVLMKYFFKNWGF